MTRRRVLLVVVAAAVALTACSRPSTGELVDDLDGIAVPDAWEQVDTHRIESGGNTDQINAGDRCNAMMDPECPKVRRWYRTVGTRAEVITDAADAAGQAGFVTEREPSRACGDVHGLCAYSAERDGLRLWVSVDDDRHDHIERDDDETVVELQLSPTF